MTTEGTHSLQHTKDTNTSKDGPKKSAVPMTVASILKEKSVCNASQGSYGFDSCTNPASSKSPHVSHHKSTGKYIDYSSNRHTAAYNHMSKDVSVDSGDDSDAERYDGGCPAVLPQRKQLTLPTRSRSR